MLFTNVVIAEEVPSEPLDVTCSSDVSEIIVGGSVTWSSNVSGGSEPYSYTWSGDASGSDSSVEVTYDTAGIYSASVMVTDGALGSEPSDCGSVVVKEEPEELVFESCTPSEVDSFIGYEITWTVNVSGGYGPYTYEITGDDGLSGNQSGASITYETAGVKTATVGTITSEDLQTISGPFECDPVTVHEEASIELDVMCVVSDTNVNPGDTVDFSAEVTGGTEPYSFVWSGDFEDEGQNLSLSFSETGNYSAQVIATDGALNTVTASCDTVSVEESSSNGGGSSNNNDDEDNNGGSSGSGGRRNVNNNSTSTTTETLPNITPNTVLTDTVVNTLPVPTVVVNDVESTTTATSTEDATSTDEVVTSGQLAGVFSAFGDFIGDIWLWLLLLILILFILWLIWKRRNREEGEDNN